MKRSALLRELRRSGCVLDRHGGRYDLWRNPANRRKAPVPRHREIRDSLAELIRQQLGLP